jgi:hypothetical protein
MDRGEFTTEFLELGVLLEVRVEREDGPRGSTEVSDSTIWAGRSSGNGYGRYERQMIDARLNIHDKGFADRWVGQLCGEGVEMGGRVLDDDTWAGKSGKEP